LLARGDEVLLHLLGREALQREAADDLLLAVLVAEGHGGLEDLPPADAAALAEAADDVDRALGPGRSLRGGEQLLAPLAARGLDQEVAGGSAHAVKTPAVPVGAGDLLAGGARHEQGLEYPLVDERDLLGRDALVVGVVAAEEGAGGGR